MAVWLDSARNDMSLSRYVWSCLRMTWSISFHLKSTLTSLGGQTCCSNFMISVWRVCILACHALLSSVLMMTQGSVCVCVTGWALLSYHLHASEGDEAWHGARSPSSGCQSCQALCRAPLEEASLWGGLLSVLFTVGWSAPWAHSPPFPSPTSPLGDNRAEVWA